MLFRSNAKKWISYSVASVSGTILAVCSCTILPLFSSIHKKGAGLGPAIAFLYSGPAINILAIILTARILGMELGIARVIGAVSFSVIIGFSMSLIYRKEEKEKADRQLTIIPPPETRPLWQTAFHFFTLVFILVFANWGKPIDETSGFWYFVWAYKWYIVSFLAILLGISLNKILNIKLLYVVIVGIPVAVLAIIFPNIPMIPFITALIGISILTSLKDDENREWLKSSWKFAKDIIPLLAIGVVTAGFLLGSTHDGTSIPGVIPNDWIAWLVGGNSVFSNLFASIVGAFMYFATLTEVPILQGLIASGMGKGPALALLLAGPALSLPNMLVIRNFMGTQKTFIYVSLVIIFSTLAGLIYGIL